jgi:hypothetical protein
MVVAGSQNVKTSIDSRAQAALSLRSKTGGRHGESVLCEVPGKQGNKESQSDHHEEQEAGNPRRLPNLRHEGLQNR